MIQCDCCGEDWEKDFFCKVCCDEPEVVDDYEDDPLDYTNSPRQIPVRREVYRSVCLNCCPGHRAAQQHRADSGKP